MENEIEDKVSFGWARQWVPAEHTPNTLARGVLSAVGVSATTLAAHSVASALGASSVGALAAGLAGFAVSGGTALALHKASQARYLERQRAVVEEQVARREGLLAQNGGSDVAPSRHAHADVYPMQDKLLLDFKRSGRLLMIESQKDRHGGDLTYLTYGLPNGASPAELNGPLLGQGRPQGRSAQFDPETGVLELKQHHYHEPSKQRYDLEAGTITSPWVEIDKGAVTKLQFGAEAQAYNRTATYKGAGQFQAGSYFRGVDIAPEAFGYQVRMQPDPREGTVTTKTRTLLQDNGIFESATVEQVLHYPPAPEGEKLLQVTAERIGGTTTVRLKSGAVIEEVWEKEGPTLRLNGKTLPDCRLGRLDETGMEILRSTQHGGPDGIHPQERSRQVFGVDGKMEFAQSTYAYGWGHGERIFVANWAPEQGMTGGTWYTFGGGDHKFDGKDLRLNDDGVFSYTEWGRTHSIELPVPPHLIAPAKPA